MLQYLINVTNSLLPTLLVAGGFVAFIGWQGRPGAGRVFIWGAVAGTLIAAVFAVLRLNTGFAIRELYNAPLLFALFIVEAALVLRLLRRKPPAAPDGAPLPWHALFVPGFLWAAFAAPALFLYPAEFAVGMDCICNSEFLGRLAGYGVALVICLSAGLAVHRLLEQGDGRWRQKMPAALLAVLCAWHLLLFVQIAVLRNWFPGASGLAGLVIVFLQYQAVFMFALVGLAAFLAILSVRAGRQRVFDGDNPARRRKERQAVRVRFRWSVFLLFNLAFAATVLTAGVHVENRVVELDPPLELKPQAGKIVIAVEKVNDGHLHRFSYLSEDGTEVRYIVIRKGEGAFGVGLDACDVCGPSGYYERNGQIICILCDVVMNISTIGFPGGCNPVPLAHVLEDGSLVIQTADLEAEAHRFR